MVSFEEIPDDDADVDSSWMELMGKDLIMKVSACRRKIYLLTPTKQH
jgi:hypothetical protein